MLTDKILDCSLSIAVPATKLLSSDTGVMLSEVAKASRTGSFGLSRHGMVPL
jgi:hypothetical protein